MLLFYYFIKNTVILQECTLNKASYTFICIFCLNMCEVHICLHLFLTLMYFCHVRGAVGKYPGLSCFCLSTCSYPHILYMSENQILSPINCQISFCEKCVCTTFWAFKHVGDRATMDSKLEEQDLLYNSCFYRVKHLAIFLSVVEKFF